MDGKLTLFVETAWTYVRCSKQWLHYVRGWNYVNCIESVAFDLDNATNECWKMQSQCRNVFQEGQADSRLDPTAVALGTIAGLLCSALVYFAIRGGFRRRPHNGDFELVENDLTLV